MKKSVPDKMPDFSKFFMVREIKPLDFSLRNGSANFEHDVAFLSSYLHDARFHPKNLKRKQGKIELFLERDCWEIGYGNNPRLKIPKELPTAKCRLDLSPVSKIEWQISKSTRTGPKAIWLEHIYAGPLNYEAEHICELIFTAPHSDFRLSIQLSTFLDSAVIRLRDLETPRFYSAARES